MLYSSALLSVPSELHILSQIFYGEGLFRRLQTIHPLNLCILFSDNQGVSFTPFPRVQDCTGVAWPKKDLWALSHCSLPHFSLQLPLELQLKPPLNGGALEIKGNNLRFSLCCRWLWEEKRILTAASISLCFFVFEREKTICFQFVYK